jgi:hypothetical protein
MRTICNKSSSGNTLKRLMFQKLACAKKHMKGEVQKISVNDGKNKIEILMSLSPQIRKKTEGRW